MAPMLFLLFLLSSPASVLPSSWTPPPANGTTEFILTSCQATEYPSLCFRSLARYANSINNSPVVLARVAANVTFAHVRSLSSHVTSLRRGPAAAGLGGMEAGALRDCASTLDSAADLARRSAEELELLRSAEGGTAEAAWRVANAQTWMSAALTDEDTCDDGFDRVGAGAVKDDVCRRVRAAKRFTANALALVNGLVAGRP